MKAFLLVATLAVGGVLPGAATAFDGTPAIQRLNAASRAAYAAGRQELLARITPVVIVGSEVTILRNGAESHLPYTPPLYEALKAISHLAIGTIGILHPYADRPQESEAHWRPHLDAMRRAALDTLPTLEGLGLAGDGLIRNQALLARILAFIDQTLASGAFGRQAILDMAREAAPLLLANAAAASRAQIDMLHAAVQSWRATLAPGEWEATRVFVLGPRMPRAGNLQFAYFRYAMGEEAVDRRLIYAEGIFDADAARSLLGTIVADRALADIVFGDAMRMDRDLLADAADVQLKVLFGRLGREHP
jgi:hypothetical protein